MASCYNGVRYLTTKQLELTQMNNTAFFSDKLDFWQYVKTRNKYNAM